MINLYRESSPALLRDIADSIERSRAEGLRQAAHSLKSASANLGATRLADLCKTLEDLGRSGDLEPAVELQPTLREEYEAVIGALERELEQA